MQPWRHLRTLRTLFLLALTLTGATALVHGAPYSSGALDDLRQALRLKIRDSMNQEELQFRKATLEKRIKALRLSDYRRALVLDGWRDRDPEDAVAAVDRAARQELVDRLTTTLREVLQRGGTAAKLAAITEISEMGTEIRAGDPPADELKNMPAEERLRWARGGLARQFTPDLIKLTEDGDPAIREFAARALGKINPDPQPATAALAKLLQGGSVGERRAAADGLLEMLSTMVLVLKSRSATGVEITREDIALVDQRVLRVAGPGIADPDVRVRRTCVSAVRLGANMLHDQVVELPESQRLDFPPAGRKLSEAEQQFVKDYRDSVEAELRQLLPVADALASQVKPVLAATSDREAEIRLLACHTLEEIGQARLRLRRKAASVPDYTPPKKDAEEKQGRVPARRSGTLVANTRVVAQAKDEDALNADPLRQPLLDSLNTLAFRAVSDERARVRLAAVDAIETLGTAAAPAVPTIVRGMSDGNLFVRWATARVIGKIGVNGVDTNLTVPPLARLLSDPDLDVNLAAANALSLYGAWAAPAVPALARAANTGDPERRVAAINALVSIGKDAEPAIPAVTAALSFNDNRVQREAADALGHFGAAATSAIPALEITLNDSDPDVRKAAADALLRITDSGK